MSPVPSQVAIRTRTQGQRYELWRDAQGTYSFFPADNAAARDRVGPDAEQVWSVEARSFEEAMRAQREYLGWVR